MNSFSNGQTPLRGGEAHSTTEIWSQAGASKEDLRRLLNHSSERITDTYIHRTTERISDIANKIQKMGGDT